MHDQRTTTRTGLRARRAGIRWPRMDARVKCSCAVRVAGAAWIANSRWRSCQCAQLNHDERPVVQVGDPRSMNTTVEMIYGHIHITETVIALTLAAFAAIVGYVAARYRDGSGRMATSRTKAIALEFSVAVGLVAFVIWLTVFIVSANSRQASALAVPTARLPTRTSGQFRAHANMGFPSGAGNAPRRSG